MYWRDKWVGPLALVMAPPALIVIFLALSRLGLFIWQFDRVAATGHYAFIFIQGLRFDAVLLAMAMILPAALTPLMATHVKVFAVWRKVFCAYMTAWFMLIGFMEISTPSFINQFDSRPNYIFVEYLQHYREVGKTLLADYPLQLLMAVLGVPLLGWLFYKLISRLPGPERPLRWLPAILLSSVVFVSFAMAGRSTLDHRPVNPSTVAVTTDHLVNELALSSAYTMLYAVYLSGEDEAGGVPYGELPFGQVVGILREEMGVRQGAFNDPELPTHHLQKPGVGPRRPYNVVIVLEESLGAEFVGSLGGLPLTPNLDALAEEGIWFENLYATGTRSVRGIEAVVSGFLPTPARSVVKLNKSQHGFFTLAKLFRDRGYDTGFIYGGEAHFDNMRRFFMGNGFNYVIDEDDYPQDAFYATWGVSDEDLFEMAHQKFKTYGETPFFSVVFTSSNHSPFEFPDGRIELYDHEKNTVNNAVKYADYALGRFIRQAERSGYWDNTLFLIIADHNSRVYGSSLLPVERFHIPGLILGGPVNEPEVIETVTSQIDMGPTLISLAGVAGEHPMVGRDLTIPENRMRAGRAIMQFNDVQGYMEGGEVVLLRHHEPPHIFHYRDHHLEKAPENRPELVRKALAYSLFAQQAYAQRLYR